MPYIFFSSHTLTSRQKSHIYPVARGSGVGGTAIFAKFVLEEDLPALGSLGIGIIFLSVLLMGAPAFKARDNLRRLRLAIYVGCTIAVYSLIDKIGVTKQNPIVYIWAMFFIAAVSLCPFVLRQYHGMILSTCKTYAPYILIIGAGSVGTYLMVLFAFTMGPVSYVVAVREFAVVIGALFGTFFLKEKITPWKIYAITMITLGIMLIKVA